MTTSDSRENLFPVWGPVSLSAWWIFLPPVQFQSQTCSLTLDWLRSLVSHESFNTFQTDANLGFPSFFWNWRISLLVFSLINCWLTTATHVLLTCSPLEDWHLDRWQWKDRDLLLMGWKEVLLLKEGVLSSETLGLVERVPACGRWLGTRWSLRPLPTELLYEVCTGHLRWISLPPPWSRACCFTDWHLAWLWVKAKARWNPEKQWLVTGSCLWCECSNS